MGKRHGPQIKISLEGKHSTGIGRIGCDSSISRGCPVLAGPSHGQHEPVLEAGGWTTGPFQPASQRCVLGRAVV